MGPRPCLYSLVSLFCHCHCIFFVVFLVYTVFAPERFPESTSGRFASHSVLDSHFLSVEIHIYGTGLGYRIRIRKLNTRFMVFLPEKAPIDCCLLSAGCLTGAAPPRPAGVALVSRSCDAYGRYERDVGPCSAVLAAALKVTRARLLGRSMGRAEGEGLLPGRRAVMRMLPRAHWPKAQAVVPWVHICMTR